MVCIVNARYVEVEIMYIISLLLHPKLCVWRGGGMCGCVGVGGVHYDRLTIELVEMVKEQKYPQIFLHFLKSQVDRNFLIFHTSKCMFQTQNYNSHMSGINRKVVLL